MKAALCVVVLALLCVQSTSSERVRRNILSLTPREQREFINAVNALREERNATGWRTYHNFVTGHAFYTHYAHIGPAFFPWHRALLLEFENELRRVSNNADLTIPYWDWSDNTTRMDIWTHDLMGGNGTEPHGFLDSGPFAHWDDSISMEGKVEKKGLVRAWGTALGAMTSMLHKIKTDVPPELPPLEELLYALSLKVYDTPPYSDESHNPPSFRNTFEGWELTGCRLHNTVHLWVGGQMRTVNIAPNDPVFWLHHSFVDKVWSVWQELYSYQPNFGYVPESGAREGHNLHDRMLPFSVTPFDMLSIKKLGYSYAKDKFDQIVKDALAPLSNL